LNKTDNEEQDVVKNLDGSKLTESKLSTSSDLTDKVSHKKTMARNGTIGVVEVAHSQVIKQNSENVEKTSQKVLGNGVYDVKESVVDKAPTENGVSFSKRIDQELMQQTSRNYAHNADVKQILKSDDKNKTEDSSLKSAQAHTVDHNQNLAIGREQIKDRANDQASESCLQKSADFETLRGVPSLPTFDSLEQIPDKSAKDFADLKLSNTSNEAPYPAKEVTLLECDQPCEKSTTKTIPAFNKSTSVSSLLNEASDLPDMMDEMSENYNSDFDVENFESLPYEKDQVRRVMAVTRYSRGDGPGYVYAFTDSSNDSMKHRIKIGASRQPYKRLQQATMLNVDIKLVSAVHVGCRKAALLDILGQLKKYAIPESKDWILGPLDDVLQIMMETGLNYPFN
jgi:hypothetical protein